MDRRLLSATWFLVIALVAAGALGRFVPADARGPVAALGLGALGVLLLVLAPGRPRASEPPRALAPPPASPPGERAEAD